MVAAASPESETASSMHSDTSSMTVTKDEVADLDSLDLDALLSTAAQNLKRDRISTQVASSKEKDSDDESEEEESADMASVKASLAKLPHLIDTFPKDHLLALTNNKTVKGTDESNSSRDLKFRTLADPVLVKQAKKAAKESNSGSQWFNMPRPELTPELRRDWQLLQMRSVLDPKRHYKKETAPIPKFFQTGTIVEGNTEFYSARLTRKERKKTIADELLADDKAKEYFKRKFVEIQQQKQSGKKKHYKKVKEMREKKR